MPFKEEMSWDASKKRWHRMHIGVMHRVPASKLGPVPTRDATRAAANLWWEKKEAELNGLVPKNEPDPQVLSLLSEIDNPAMTAMIEAFIEPMPAGRAKDNDRSVKACGQNFLAVVKGDMKPLSYRELRQYIEGLTTKSNRLRPEADVEMIDEALIEKMYLDLRKSGLSSGVKKKRWGFFRRFVRYLWERRLIEMPRNLHSHTFEVKAKAIKTYEPAEVRKVLKSLKPRLQLYALLGLNCGMTSADIGQLKKDQVDLKKGTLTRKRVKTGDNDNVPVVCYKLWPQTRELFEKCWSVHPMLALTSMNDTPLWESRHEGDNTPQKDLIYQQFKRAKATLTHKTFRSISATWIESHPVYGRCTSYFLGHSPKSVKDRHYAAPPQQLFDQALDWLREHLFS